MARFSNDISALRLFTLLAVVGAALFVATLYAPWPATDFPLTFRVLTAAYLALVLCLIGIVGLLLTQRGEPLFLLSVNLLLTPCFFAFWFSSGAEFVGHFSTFLYTCAVGFQSFACFQRA